MFFCTGSFYVVQKSLEFTYLKLKAILLPQPPHPALQTVLIRSTSYIFLFFSNVSNALSRISSSINTGIKSATPTYSSGEEVVGRSFRKIPFLWPCSSSWECLPPSLLPRVHAETPATAVSGPSRREIGGSRRWGHGCAAGGAGEQVGEAFGEDGDSGDPERTCSQGGGSYLTVHNGLLFLQLDLLLSCLSTQQSLKDWPFRKATLLLQGYLTIWGQSTGKVVSIEEAVTRVPRLWGGGA